MRCEATWQTQAGLQPRGVPNVGGDPGPRRTATHCGVTWQVQADLKSRRSLARLDLRSVEEAGKVKRRVW